MFFSTTPRRVWATAMPLLSLLTLLLSSPQPLLAADISVNEVFAGPVARAIPSQTVDIRTPHELVVNGSFTGDRLTYSATLADGTALPDWLSFSATTATFNILAPVSTVGQILKVKVTAKSPDGLTASSSFHLTIDDTAPDCRVDANTDRLGKILSCDGDVVKLRGYIHNGIYRWTGPNGFTSEEREPEVSVPGTYVLTTDANSRVSCPTSATVEVIKLSSCDADTGDNRLPSVLIQSDVTTGVGPLTVHFDGAKTHDPDGAVLRYRWSWEGGSATGPRPVVTFKEGTYEVILTVTDDNGARSTDRVNIVAQPRPAYTTYWLEAECGQVGSNWQIASSTQASRGDYVVSLLSSKSSAPAAVPENIVRFTVQEAKQTAFQLYARIDARDISTDSYYVRLNGGAWYAWTSGIITGRGYQWNRMPQTLNFVRGTNTVEIAFREPNVRLDKIFLSASGEVPSGLGGLDETCDAPNQPPLAVASANTVYGTAPLSVTLDGSASSDVDGTIAAYHWEWNGGSADGVTAPLTLPFGSHTVTLTVTDDEGAEDSDELIIEVEVPMEPEEPMNPTPPTAPTGSGGYWLEAECAEVGRQWEKQTNSAASSGKYVVFSGNSSMSVVPADLADNQVRFSVSVAEAGNYRLFARINAPSNAKDSYWVRLNGGSWYKWSSGMQQGKGFAWNKLPIDLTLQSGTNTIDFSYREAGTQLDKLYLTRGGNQPSGNGAEATNCAAAALTAVEAECAVRNTGWTSRTATSAAGGSYMVYGGQRHLDVPTESNPGQEIIYEVETSVDGIHHLFLRVDAPDPTSNSVWVQVDYGEWILFWKEDNGQQLLTKGFEWRKVNQDGKSISFNLGQGLHTIRLVNRESGTKIDKLYLSTDTQVPTGTGPQSAACGSTGTQSVSLQTMFSSTAPTAEEVKESVEVVPTASIFPNPATDRLTLELSSLHTGTVDLMIYDMNGRRIRQEQFLKEATQSSTEVSVGSLPSGVYQLRVIEGDRATTRSFVVGR